MKRTCGVFVATIAALVAVGCAEGPRDEQLVTGVQVAGDASPAETPPSVTIDLCTPPPMDTIDPDGKFGMILEMPEQAEAQERASKERAAAQSDGATTDAAIDQAIELMATNDLLRAALEKPGTKVREVRAWRDGAGAERGMEITLSFDSPTDVPNLGSFVDGTDAQDDSEILYGANNLPVLEKDPGDDVLQGALIAWVQIDATSNQLFHVGIVDTPDYDPCPWSE